MRKAKVYVSGKEAGILCEVRQGSKYTFEYNEGYSGLEVSRTMLPSQRTYSFDSFPPFFEGLLPEGIQLDGLLRNVKIDKSDLFSQLMAVGNDVVGAVTIEEISA